MTITRWFWKHWEKKGGECFLQKRDRVLSAEEDRLRKDGWPIVKGIGLPPFLALALPSKRKPFIMRKRLLLVFVLAWVAAVPATSWAQKGKIKIAVQGPLSGDQSAFGEHIKLGAQLAVEESVKAFKAMGYDLVLVPHDDQAKPEVGVANARYIVADPDVLGCGRPL